MCILSFRTSVACNRHNFYVVVPSYSYDIISIRTNGCWRNQERRWIKEISIKWANEVCFHESTSLDDFILPSAIHVNSTNLIALYRCYGNHSLSLHFLKEVSTIMLTSPRNELRSATCIYTSVMKVIIPLAVTTGGLLHLIEQSSGYYAIGNPNINWRAY